MWRYVVSKEYASEANKTDVIYGIRELFNDGEGWSEPRIEPLGETYEELLYDLHLMLDDAREGTILDLTLDPPAVVRAEEL